MSDRVRDGPAGGIGERAIRPDGVAKVRGEFAFAGDLWAEGMLWGQALRSPHPSARIRGIDIGPALAITGVHAVLTADDVPVNRYGLEHRDQPVLAADVVRYAGEPVAIVAADHPDTAPGVRGDRRRLRGSRAARRCRARSTRRPIHPDGNVFRDLVIRRGDPDVRGRSWSRALRDRHAGPGVHGARGGPGHARPPTAASISSCRPSGCTTTATRSPSASASRPSRSA